MNMLQAVPLLRPEDLNLLGWGLARFAPESKWRHDLGGAGPIKSIDETNWRTFMFRDLDESIVTMYNWYRWLGNADPNITRIIMVLEEVRAKNKGLQKLRECGNEVAPELRD